MPEVQQPTVYKRFPKAIWEQFCQEFEIFFSMAVSNTVLVDGVEIDSLDSLIHFGISDSASSVQTKVVSCVHFNLVRGARIIVAFENTNTAASPKLNVNGTGAVSLYYKGRHLPTKAISAGSVREFVYDGTNFHLIGDLGDPIGTIKEVLGSTTPEGYLKCDGSTYNISQYQELAAYISDQFSTVNHFGGDGTTTFAVPNKTNSDADCIYCIKYTH